MPGNNHPTRFTHQQYEGEASQGLLLADRSQRPRRERYEEKAHAESPDNAGLDQLPHPGVKREAPLHQQHSDTGDPHAERQHHTGIEFVHGHAHQWHQQQRTKTAK